MSPPDGWVVSPVPGGWDLLLSYAKSGRGAWYRISGDGHHSGFEVGAKATHGLVSPDGSRVLLTQAIPFYEGEHRNRLVARLVVDLRSGTEAACDFAVDADSAWSNDSSRFAHASDSPGRSEFDRQSILVIRDSRSEVLVQASTRPVRCLRWGLDDRELFAVVGDRQSVSLARYSVEDLSLLGEVDLPIHSDAFRFSISPDIARLAFCDDSSSDEDEDEDERGPFTLSVLELSDRVATPVGPAYFETRVEWNPSGGGLAYVRHNDSVTLFDVPTRRSVLLASINSGDCMRDMGSHLAWSPDGRFLGFTSYEEGGSVIHVAEVATGTLVEVLRTDGLVHWIGLVARP
jgi:hypothetical protein